MLKLKTIGVLITFLPFYGMSTICTSVGSGNWETGGTWDIGGVPACGDTIYILAGHTVSVTTNNSTLDCATPSYIVIRGTLNFASSGDKIHLGCNSGIKIESGGEITASGSGGGSSSQITICNNEVWSKSDGTISGPFSYGEPLPVELAYFGVNLNSNNAVLEWISATEINCDYYNIERSSDGMNWEVIGVKKGSGTSSTTTTYTYTDPLVKNGIYFYRLIQMDADGRENIFGPVNLSYEIVDDIIPYPNPSTGIINYSLANDDQIISVSDLSGRLIYQAVKTAGSHTLDLGHLQKGVYFITLQTENSSSTKQVELQ